MHNRILYNNHNAQLCIMCIKFSKTRSSASNLIPLGAEPGGVHERTGL